MVLQACLQMQGRRQGEPDKVIGLLIISSPVNLQVNTDSEIFRFCSELPNNQQILNLVLSL